MTLSQTRRLMLALTAQVVLCLSAAPALAANLTPETDSKQKDSNPKPEAAFQAARDAANVRPEEVNDREHSRGMQIPGSRNLRLKHLPQTYETAGGANLPDSIDLQQDWLARWGADYLFIGATHSDLSFFPRIEVGTFLQPTGPPTAN
jgi:hypothetical protein